MDAMMRRRWHNMLLAALADGELGPEEKQYLESMRKELGLTSQEANEIVKEWRAGKGGIELSGSHEERVGLLRDVIKVFLADGELGKHERKMMVAVANHLKMDESALKSLIAECSQESLASPASSLATAADSGPSSSEAPAPAGAVETHAKTGIELINVPEGVFYYGDMSVGGIEPDKAHNQFKIGRFAVTNEQWLLFEKDCGHAGRVDYGERFNGPRQPVVGVSLDDALAFCEWAQLRLPTEVEWERAARGTDGRVYPWGGEYPDDQYANFGRGLFADRQPRTLPVDALPEGISPVGCFNMAGNTDEWCLNPDRAGECDAPTRGGNWLSAAYALNVYYHRSRARDYRDETLGFRVAADG